MIQPTFIVEQSGSYLHIPAFHNRSCTYISFGNDREARLPQKSKGSYKFFRRFIGLLCSNQRPEVSQELQAL